MADESVQSIKRILVPLDLSNLGEGKITVAESQARAFGAELILLHVIPSEAPADGAISPAESQALTYLGTVAARLRTDGTKAGPLVRYGPVAETVLDEIAVQQVDLVIIGSNIRRGLSRLLLGSVAEEIIARSPCPVLLVRPTVTEAHVSLVRSFTDDAARAGPLAPHRLGLRTVELNRIVGSVGRAMELDTNFRIQNRERKEMERYKRVLTAMQGDVSLPPVVLYKLGYGYYVLDGNHRVAAALELGQLDIEAEVTEFLPIGDHEGRRVFVERRAFEEATGLTRIGVAQSGNYPHLTHMVRDFARENQLADLRQAARVWESRVYRPIAARIRSLRLSRYFPGERTADIFVSLADFRDHESEREGRPLDWEEAIARFQAHLTGQRREAAVTQGA